jgi:threonine dehydratase
MSDSPSRDAGAVHADDVEAASRRLGAALSPTPLLFNGRRSAWLKLENLQATGAYKVRGALNALLLQVERGDRRPVVAASAGNHGKGLAWAARHVGLAATVVVPRTAPEAKIAGARELGARVIEVDGSFEDCTAVARELAAIEGARFVHPFDEPEVIAGQGTVAVELERAAIVKPDVVVVPIGGGGLAAGMALWLSPLGVRVVGAQVEGVDAMRRRLRGDEEIAPRPTLADGLAVRRPGERTTAICRRLLDDIVVVTEHEVRRAVAELALWDKLIVEGAGAVAVAALAHVRGEPRVAVVSGGNLDLPALSEVSRPFTCRA